MPCLASTLLHTPTRTHQAVRLQELKFQCAVRDQIITEQRDVIGNVWRILGASGLSREEVLAVARREGILMQARVWGGPGGVKGRQGGWGAQGPGEGAAQEAGVLFGPNRRLRSSEALASLGLMALWREAEPEHACCIENRAARSQRLLR